MPRDDRTGTDDGEAGGAGAETGAADDAVDEAFGLVSDEIRAGIVRALGDDAGRESPWEPVSFSELRSRVDPEIDSAQFNYHLQKLVGRFVAKGEAGYRLRPAGMKLYRAVRAGSFTREVSLDPFPVGRDCYNCGGAVAASYDDGVFEVACPDCGRVYEHTLVPPSAVEGADERELLDRVDRYNRHRSLAKARGVCPVCASALGATFVRPAETPMLDAEELDVVVRRPCDHCGARSYMSVGLALLYDPDLVAFCRERGLDVTETPRWELEFAMTDRDVTVRSTDPWEVALQIELDGDALELVVDDDLNVVERNRS
ncbi:winged helix-turn-helix domain-containing protein [Halorussus sp. AFM4]|uniref:winged helix-turn-helix domain-containing protein n=1 Tax=Halorussus sp. AFM4 TaxID=3421651 RepID=UPI003EB9FE5C